MITELDSEHRTMAVISIKVKTVPVMQYDLSVLRLMRVKQ